MTNIQPNLRKQIDAHPWLGYKEVVYEGRVFVLFYDVQKDDSGHEYFDEFFVTGLDGEQADDFTDQQYNELKKLV